MAIFHFLDTPVYKSCYESLISTILHLVWKTTILQNSWNILRDFYVKRRHLWLYLRLFANIWGSKSVVVYLVIKSLKVPRLWLRGGVESNEFRLDFYRIFRIIFRLRINRIINFWIESNEFRTNPASEKFDSTL